LLLTKVALILAINWSFFILLILVALAASALAFEEVEEGRSRSAELSLYVRSFQRRL
jgi:hypothetical protein